MVLITIVTGDYKPTYNWGAQNQNHPSVSPWKPGAEPEELHLFSSRNLRGARSILSPKNAVLMGY